MRKRNSIVRADNEGGQLGGEIEYDKARYIKNLKALPALPFDDEEEI